MSVCIPESPIAVQINGKSFQLVGSSAGVSIDAGSYIVDQDNTLDIPVFEWYCHREDETLPEDMVDIHVPGETGIQPYLVEFKNNELNGTTLKFRN